MEKIQLTNQLPTISVLIPTLNTEKVLTMCLDSVLVQDYPKEKLEIIIADGGSIDKTLAIAKKYGAKVYPNLLKTGEAGKAVALRHAKGELVALIDSDNILPHRDWFLKMVKPFEDKEVFGSEPLEYTWRSKDGFITRYCALIGMNDPLCLFLGNYDRMNFLTNKWTNVPLKSEDKEGWIKATLPKGVLPTIGANGTILRRSFFKDYTIGDYFVDIDVIYDLVNKGSNKFAKVKTSIVHLYCGSNIKTFMRKQKRRIKDFLFLKKENVRSYPWQETNKAGVFKFVFYSVTVLPVLFQAVKGFSRKRDAAWFFHPLACWLTLYVYGVGVFQNIFKTETLKRDKWSQ